MAYLQLPQAEFIWDPTLLTEVLVIFLFTLNQDTRLENTEHIVQDQRIFPILLNVYLNTLLLQSCHNQGHFQSQQQDKLAFILLSKVFKYSSGMPFGDQSNFSLADRSSLKQLSDSQKETLVFLKQNLLLNTKFPQKLTFNFIKQFCSDGQNISFNELNLRKCLTIRLKQPDDSDPQQRGS